jgi:hypothetical protein
MNDIREGVNSVHAKLWSPGSELQRSEMELRDWWEGEKLEMERYHRGVSAEIDLIKEEIRKKKHL